MLADRSKALEAKDSKKDNPVDAINTLKEIEEKGERLGEGTYGVAYKIGDKVYKIYHATKTYDENIPFDPEKGEKKIRSAERSKFYWNKIYKEIYNGKYAHLATADVITINDRDVLITPFIEGDPAYLNDHSSAEAREQFEKEINKLNVQMRDFYISDNVRMMGSTNDPLPVDFDAFYRRPKCIGRINPSDEYPSYAFFADEEPPSPGSRAWAKNCYHKLLHFNYPRPVIAPASTTLESKGEALPAAEAALVAKSKASQLLEIPSQTSEVSETQDSLEKKREKAMTIINSYRRQDAWFKWFGKRRAVELSVELQECKTTNALSNRIQQFINDGKTQSDYNCFWKLFSWTQSSGTSEASLRRMFQKNLKL